MQLLFTTLPSKKTTIREIPEDTNTDILLQRQLQQRNTSVFNASTTQESFSNQTYFSNTTMFSRVASGVIGCASCARKQ